MGGMFLVTSSESILGREMLTLAFILSSARADRSQPLDRTSKP